MPSKQHLLNRIKKMLQSNDTHLAVDLHQFFSDIDQAAEYENLPVAGEKNIDTPSN